MKSFCDIPCVARERGGDEMGGRMARNRGVATEKGNDRGGGKGEVKACKDA